MLLLFIDQNDENMKQFWCFQNIHPGEDCEGGGMSSNLTCMGWLNGIHNPREELEIVITSCRPGWKYANLVSNILDGKITPGLQGRLLWLDKEKFRMKVKEIWHDIWWHWHASTSCSETLYNMNFYIFYTICIGQKCIIFEVWMIYLKYLKISVQCVHYTFLVSDNAYNFLGQPSY